MQLETSKIHLRLWFWWLVCTRMLSRDGLCFFSGLFTFNERFDATRVMNVLMLLNTLRLSLLFGQFSSIKSNGVIIYMDEKLNTSALTIYFIKFSKSSNELF